MLVFLATLILALIEMPLGYAGSKPEAASVTCSHKSSFTFLR